VEFTNEFTVPVGVDRAFAVLTDLEQVAPCLPGATLEEVHGDAYTGKVKVKVGPIAVTYRGTAEVTERDATSHHAVINAKGKEARGAGTAAADVTADLSAAGDDVTRVTVVTDLSVTGKPAQFGRGVMDDVGTKLIDTFADRLRAMLEADEHPPSDAAPASTPGADTLPATSPLISDTDPTMAPIDPAAGARAGRTAPPETGPRRIAPPAQEPDALDLMDVAGGALSKRVGPLVVASVAVVGLLWWRRRRRRQG
jgi:carbon monoxide dehydrogenase subunit G